MVKIPPQYPDKLTYSRLTEELNEYNQPITTVIEGELIGRLENFSKGDAKEFTGKDGITILSDATYYSEVSQDLPLRFDEVNVTTRGFKGYILNVYKGFFNTTIYLKEVK